MDLATALATLRAADGSITIVAGRLRVEVEGDLPDEVWAAISENRGRVAALVADQWHPDEHDLTWRRPSLMPPDGVDQCRHCGHRGTVDVEIHCGQSIRRDCGRCGKFWKFVRWHGVEMP